MKTKPDLTLEKRIFRPNIFFFEQLTQNIILIINDQTTARSAMLQQIRQYFSLNPTHLTAIDNFAEKYQSNHAAHWYTKDSFLHRVINKVLREGNLECSNLLRCYLSDLSEQIYRLKCYQQRNVTQKANTILYRGLRQSDAHLMLLKNLVGQIILTKGFMSTTADMNTALLFAAPLHPQSPESQSLVIEISVDMTAPDIIAADISHLSEFPDEKEILFDIGSRFIVESLEYDLLHSTWYCRLLAISNEYQIVILSKPMPSSDNDRDLRTDSEKEGRLERVSGREHRRHFFPLTDDHNNDSFWSKSPSASWIAVSAMDRARIAFQRSLINWHKTSDTAQLYSECKPAWELYKSDSSDKFDDARDAASFLNNLGSIYQELKMLDDAIVLLKESSEIRDRIGSPAHFRAQSLRNLALAYIDKGNFEHALTSLKQALIIGQQSVPISQWSISMTLRNFVNFYHAKSDYRQAIEYYFKAVETLEQCVNLDDKCYKKIT